MNSGADQNYLQKLPIFKDFPKDRLSELESALKPGSLPKDTVIFEENSKGDSLFALVSGTVRIEKKLDPAGKSFKTLAVMGEGDFFGEMALLGANVRFARAVTASDSFLLELRKEDLFRLIEKTPVAAIGFFVELLRVISARLRKTSTELMMLYDLSRLISETHKSEKEFLAKILSEAVSHLEGQWSATAYLSDIFSGELEPAGQTGEGAAKIRMPQISAAGTDNRWIDGSTFLVVLPGKLKPDGYFLFRTDENLTPQEKSSLAVSFATLGYITDIALQNMRNAVENDLRNRLQTQKYNPM